jgi:hypothetical protein
MSARLRAPLFVAAVLLAVVALAFAVTPALSQNSTAASGTEAEEAGLVPADVASSTKRAGARLLDARAGRGAARTTPETPETTVPAPTEDEAANSPAADPSATDTAVPTPSARTSSSSPARSSTVEAPVAAASTGPSLMPSGSWMSGAAGDGVASGEYAAWRGSGLGIAGTWSDNNEAQLGLWALRPGADLDDWGTSVDIAIGAIGDGETWEEAARGAYDARWRESLTSMRELWAHHEGTLFIRFAHEMNGDWYSWSVDPGNAAAFVEAWRHFRALQQEIFPEGQLVFCVNKETVGSDLDWRTIFPGSQYVDVMGVDYYNAWPHVSDQASWDASVGELDGTGAPKGLQAHLDFARSVGLPLSVPEWSGKANVGDSPAFIENMHAFFTRNAGGGPGQLLYEILFNVDMHGNDYRIFGDTLMPLSAETYRRLF